MRETGGGRRETGSGVVVIPSGAAQRRRRGIAVVPIEGAGKASHQSRVGQWESSVVSRECPRRRNRGLMPEDSY